MSNYDLVKGHDPAAEEAADQIVPVEAEPVPVEEPVDKPVVKPTPVVN